MATRGNRPKDPRAIKGGVRGTHGLGDAPREKEAPSPVATRGGTAAPIDGDHSGGTLHESHVGMRAEAPRARVARQAREADGESAQADGDGGSVGEEREFELSNAMADLETADERAARRERAAREAIERERRHAESGEGEDDLAAWEVDAGAEGVLGDPRSDPQERRDLRSDREHRGLDTVKTHGPGPKDEGKGTARTKDLDERGIERR